jgi:tetratricopeptide (TPR) repeat protein
MESELKNYAGAIADYAKAIELNPKLATAYKDRGDAMVQLKKYQEALADYNRAIAISPQYSDALEARFSVEQILDSSKK